MAAAVDSSTVLNDAMKRLNVGQHQHAHQRRRKKPRRGGNTRTNNNSHHNHTAKVRRTEAASQRSHSFARAWTTPAAAETPYSPETPLRTRPDSDLSLTPAASVGRDELSNDAAATAAAKDSRPDSDVKLQRDLNYIYVSAHILLEGQAQAARRHF